MEVLIATLLPRIPQSEQDLHTDLRFVRDTLSNSPGVISCIAYHILSTELSYLLLTTIEEQAISLNERIDPLKLLQNHLPDPFAINGQQFTLHYLWGYYRPATIPTLSTLQMIHIKPEQSDFVQQGWLQGLNHLEPAPPLSFAFLARGRSSSTPNIPYTTFFQLLSWHSHAERDSFINTTEYRAIETFARNLGVLETLSLETL